MALIEGWPLMRGILDTIIQSLLPDIMALYIYIRGVASGEGGHI